MHSSPPPPPPPDNLSGIWGLKPLISLVTFLLLSVLAYAQNDTTNHFVLKITTNSGTDAGEKTFIFNSQDTDYMVDWGEGGGFENVTTGDVFHDFNSPGVKMIRFKDLNDVYINDRTGKEKYTSIEQWGTSVWDADMSFAFQGASNLTMNTNAGTPKMGMVTNMAYMFEGATAFNGNIGNWNTAQVTNMSQMFSGTTFNQDVGEWNTASVASMRSMFSAATAFDQNIGGWNVETVRDMESMFNGATAFNQDIGNWNTAQVTNMYSMFSVATAFDQNIGGWNVEMFNGATAFNQDIGNWNTAQVTNMYSMFSVATAFDQNIGGWNVETVRDMESMFSRDFDIQKNVTLSIANYDSLLVGWNRQNLQLGISFDGGGSHYNSDVAHTARENMINSDGWRITDGGRVIIPPNVHAPIFAGGAVATVAYYVGNTTTTVTTVVATDADAGQAVTFTLTGGTDVALFSITPTGVLTFNTAPDFQHPADTGGDNMYEIIVTATDGHPSPMTAMQTLTITVTDVDEGGNVPTGLEAFTDIVVYPNPAGAVLHISGVERNARYTLSGIDGKILKRGKLKADTGDHSVAIPLLNKGIYLLQLTTGKGSITRKIVKE